MYACSPCRVDENAWNEDQQEPSKKVLKSEDVVVQIDLADFAEAPVAFNDKVENISDADGGHQNGQDEGGHQNGQEEGGHQNGHNGDVKNGHPVEADANGHNIEDELDQLYHDYGYGAAVEIGTQPKLADLIETDMSPKADELVEAPQKEEAGDVPDCGDQSLKTAEEPQKNLVQEYETENEPMELKVSEEADEDILDSINEKVLLRLLKLYPNSKAIISWLRPVCYYVFFYFRIKSLLKP
jgi:hypothetical protein